MGGIAFGQYYPTDSVLHRLDPRVKFIGTILFIVSLFLAKGPVGYGLCACALLCVILISKVPFSLFLKSMRPIIMILIVTMIFNVLLTPGEVIARFFIFRITREGCIMAIRMGFRLILLVMGSSVMTLTTTPNALTDGMERLFRPLKVIHVPVHEIAMMMSIALRFIPILLEETDKIRKAQIARGADFDTGGLIKRLQGMIPLLVPLFVSAFRRAGDLAMAMEARCYHGGEGRTQMRPLHFENRDYIACGIMAAFVALCAVCGYFGW
ncbi:MAG: energy-coupling factor transporter transmembrane component T [Lachnospiraceae bacterium]|nr:energy-coupling factor transporter transmembrane component T [Lachnospiraceae bacterium]